LALQTGFTANHFNCVPHNIVLSMTSTASISASCM